jgi:ABC-type lipoprotein release transport system permease subunit
MFMAIDPAQEVPAHNFFLRALVAGEMFVDGQGRGAVVGSELAAKLRLQPGRRLVLTVTDKDGELTSELLRVSGIFHTGDHGADAGIVLLPLGRMRDTLGYGADGATLVAVYADDLRRVETIRANLARLFADRRDLEVLAWQETQADLAGLIAVDRLFNYLIQLLVGLVIAAGIMNTMHMSVLERSREFGIMLALGMAPGQAVRLVLVESFWLGCLGLLLGILITAPWFAYMSRTGIDLSGLVGRDYSAGGVLVDPVMKLRLFAESGLAILAVIFVLTLAAAIYPAIRAGRVPPAQAIKEA